MVEVPLISVLKTIAKGRKNMIKVVVSDSGIGISPGKHSKSYLIASVKSKIPPQKLLAEQDWDCQYPRSYAN
jgi:hypothetical protein